MQAAHLVRERAALTPYPMILTSAGGEHFLAEIGCLLRH
jgi:hypothetical protein